MRIAILKLDHIGDLVTAMPALFLLRNSFAAAHITLLCAPWNVRLAERLGVADVVRPASFFSQVSASDAEAPGVDERKRRFVAEIAALSLGRFDIAIDLRRDEDTRELLKLLDARVYAGFGDLATYGYLDVAMPVTHLGEHEGASSLHLAPEDLRGTSDHRVSPAGLHLSADMAALDLTIATDTVWAPADDGEPDDRPLGASLWEIHVRRRNGAADDAGSPQLSFPVALSRDRMEFGPGWLAWEPWGRWSSMAEAHLTISLDTADPEVALLVRVQGHTAASHPHARVIVSSGDRSVAHDFRAGDEPVTLPLACRARTTTPVARAAPRLLRAGRYRGNMRISLPAIEDWEPVTLTLRGARLGNIVATLVTPDAVADAGILNFPFEVDLKDAAEPLEIEVSSAGLRPERRLAIQAIELDCLQARSPLLPVTHMETQLLDLAAMVALRFAPTLAAPGSEGVRRLTEARAGSTATAPIAVLRGRRSAGGGWWRKPPARMLLGIGIGANKETKLWPEAHFVDLCRRLLQRPEVCLVFIGGPAEAGSIAALVADLDAGDRAIDLCASCRIEDLGELLAELDGFIGLDTGTTHLAGRIGLNTFALFGVSHDPIEWAPVGEKSGWAGMDVPCRSCSKSLASHCGFGLDCMTLLTPDIVWPMIQARFFG